MTDPTTPPDPGSKMDELDELVQRASTPNLATLFRRGKEAGLIKPTTGYGEGAA